MSHISGDEVLKNIKLANLYYQQILIHMLRSKPEGFSNNFFTTQEAPNMISKLVNYSLKHPEKFNQVNIEHIGKLHKLMADTVNKFTNQEGANNELQDEIRDRRFKDPAWKNNIYFDFIRQYYFLSSQWLRNNIDQYDFDLEIKRYLEFISNQFMNALSPSNFVFSNPEVIRESLDTSLNNIVKGMENFLHDIEKSKGLFSITTTDKKHFRLGENIATTEGKVIYQNDLAQLICYKPKKEVYNIPIFIIPPWINKYYILDLSKSNSLIKWLVENNFQVFLVSWVNPKEEHKNIDFEDYLELGILKPYQEIKKLGFNKVNAVGYLYWRNAISIVLGGVEK